LHPPLRQRREARWTHPLACKSQGDRKGSDHRLRLRRHPLSRSVSGNFSRPGPGDIPELWPRPTRAARSPTAKGRTFPAACRC
jgi:hypothetical protein